MKALYKFLMTLFISAFAMTTFGQDNITKKQLADQLYSKKICSEQGYRSLLNEIESNQLTNSLDFLNYCDKAVIINLNNYPEKPQDYLEKIHSDVSKPLPELTFTDFKFKVVLDSTNSFDDNKFYKFVVSLKSNGKIYRQESSYHLHSVSKNEYFGGKIDQQQFYKIFNKILADLQSPYRLHEVKSFPVNSDNWYKFGIIALTKDQADMLHGVPE
jgi:hypothetical protein